MNPPLFILRQTAAELLGLAVVDLFPGAQLVDSGATEFGFFCDVYAEQPIDEQGVILLEEKLRGIIKSNLDIRTIEMMRENAVHFLEHRGQTFKADAVQKAKSNIVSLVQIGDFCDYSPGTYLLHTQEVGVFKLFEVETLSHYIEGEGECTVKRIHGTAFAEKDSLKKYLKVRAASLKLDYRQIAKQMQLFTINDSVSEYAWTWETQGVMVKDLLIGWWKNEHLAQEFSLLSSPKLVKESLVEEVGGFDFSEEAYLPPSCEIRGEPFVIPPSLTPVHAEIFRSTANLNSQLPVRYAEVGTIIPGTKTGHYRGMGQCNHVEADYAHVFCNLEQLEKELISSLQFIDKIIKMFGFEYYWCFAEGLEEKRLPRKVKGQAVELFKKAFEKSGLKFSEVFVEGLFVGPIAQARLVDSFGREWNGPKVGVDFKISTSLNKQERALDRANSPIVVVVRSIFGTLERFVALLLEHYRGKLPFWLVPEQVRVALVNEGCREYAIAVCKRLNREGIRVRMNGGPEPLGVKIREAREMNIPYVLVVGEKEESSNQITLRSCADETHQMMGIDELVNKFHRDALHGDEKPL